MTEEGKRRIADATDPMVEVLIWRLTQLPRLTDRQKRLGKALYRYISERADERRKIWLLTAGRSR